MRNDARYSNVNLQNTEDLYRCWQDSPYPSVKINSYFPVYAELFGHLRGTRCTFIETGVLDGGSLFMWRSWLGPEARIIGVDLNPAAERWRSDGFEIHIGDQGDPGFWRTTFESIGRFDALLDDGGHQSFQQIVTCQEALRAADHASVIAIEDTFCSFMEDFARHGRASFLEYSKAATDMLVGKSISIYADRLPTQRNDAMIELYRNVHSVQFHHGIVAFMVDPARCLAPQIIRNRPPNVASDFRYEGLDSATVNWPSPFEARSVTVKGGKVDPLFSKVRSLVRRSKKP